MITATLGGITLSGPDPIVWELRRGVSPYTTRITVNRGHAAPLAKKIGEPLTLDLGAGRVVNGVYIVSTEAANHEDLVRLVVADSRIWWGWHWISQDYNISRRVGETRLVGDGTIETKTVAEDIAHKPHSLKGYTNVYTVSEALARVFEGLEEDVDIPELNRKIKLQDAPVNMPGDQAIMQLLRYAPGYEVMPRPDGKYALTDALDTLETTLIKQAGALSRSGQHPTISVRSPMRPRGMHVYQQREVELRFDFHEYTSSDPGPTDARTADKKRPPRRIENVIRVPDKEIEVAGRTVGEGSVVRLDDYLEAEAVSSGWPSAAPGPLNLSNLLRFYNAPWHLDKLYTIDQSGNKDELLTRRLKQIMRDFRQTFRILPAWMDKISSLRAYRLGTIDYETGSRGPAQAFMDFTAFPSRRGLYAKKKAQKVYDTWIVEGYADNLADAKSAPAEIRVLDPDMGLIRIYLLQDEAGFADKLVPGKLEYLPVISAGAAGFYKGPEAAYAAFRSGQPLSSDFSIGLVLTATPGVPNDTSRHHKTEITPAEAGQKLGVQLGECKGPVREVMLPASPATTVRHLWLDEYADQIDDAFFEGSEYPPQTIINKEHAEALANAYAASVYAANRDRYIGRVRCSPNGALLPIGSASSIRHVIEPGVPGDYYTEIVFSEDGPPRNPWAFVDPQVQVLLRGLVSP